jgi:two-component system, sensor histidine kinase LadS
MSFKKSVSTLLLFLVFAYGGIAQIQIFVHGKQVDQAMEWEYALDGLAPFTDEGLRDIQSMEWLPFQGIPPKISYTSTNVWLKINLEKLAEEGELHWIRIDNPHINRLKVWALSEGTVQKEFPITGDAFEFESRGIPSTSYIFPLTDIPIECSELIFAIDKRYTKLEIPLFFESNSELLGNSESNSIWIFFFLGICFFLFLFNGFLFISTKESVFGWYLAYLMLTSTYIGTDTGLLFKYIYPNFPQINDIIRPASMAFGMAPMLIFFNKILELEKYSVRLYRLNKILLLVFLAIFLVAVGSSAWTLDPLIQQFWLKANRVVTPLIMFILMLESVYFMKIGRPLAIFSFGSFFSLMFFSLIYVGLQIEWLPITPLTTHSLYFGLGADAFFMGISLAWRFNLFRQTVDRLLIEKSIRQEKVTKEINNWKEQQMSQVSSLLHDHIGGLIGVLRFSLDNMELTPQGKEKIAVEIQSIGEEIRQYSHSFSPVHLETLGLHRALEIQMEKFKVKTKIQLNYEWLGPTAITSKNFQLILYQIVQEILQNILKHSKATTASLQIIQSEEVLSIYAEDDGIGCDYIPFEKGIGLQSIKRIIEVIGGDFQVNSSSQTGFSLSVELPKN